VAIYSASVKSIGRSSGRSATAAAAYRTGTKVIDYRTGTIHDYTKKGGVDHVSMHLPNGTPTMTTEDLWNRAEAAENRKNSVVARELLVALPHELSDLQRRALAEQIAAALVERYGVAAQVAVHEPDAEGDQKNHHAHIQFTTRRMGSSGQMGEKTRELDEKPRSSAEVEWMRRMVEIKTNGALIFAGRPERVDRRSLVEQDAAASSEMAAALVAGPPAPEQRAQLARIDALGREPTMHEGPRVTQIRRECVKHKRLPLGLCQRMAANDAISHDAADRVELSELDAQIYYLEKIAPARAAAAAERLRIEQQQADGRRRAGLREQQAQARQELRAAQGGAQKLRERLDAPDPQFVAKMLKQKKTVEQLSLDAERRRREHPVRSWLAERLGIELSAEKVEREAYDRSPELALVKAWRDEQTRLKQELAGIEQRLPALRERPQQIDDELLQLTGPDMLCQSIQRLLDRAERAEKHIEPETRIEQQARRGELVVRMKTEAPSKLVAVYRDAEALVKQSEWLVEECMRARSIAALSEARRTLHEARQTLQQQRTGQPELADSIKALDSKLRTWLMDPLNLPTVDDCEMTLKQAVELREQAAQLLDQSHRLKPEKQIDERPLPGDIAPRSRGPG